MIRGFRVQGSGFSESRVATRRKARTSCIDSQSAVSCVARRLTLQPIRNGFTLVELLITIMILGILAGLFLGASNAAMESAREARTKTNIAKIHTLLMERWESYHTRRVELNNTLSGALNGLDTGIRGQVTIDARLMATRELMKLEMPDRWSDLLAGGNDYNGDGSLDPDVLNSLPAITRLYRRQLVRVLNKFGVNDVDALNAEQRNTLLANQGAECLFMIVMHHTGDGEARTLFSRQDIGDTDGDGAQEFLDGWGRPIEFIRWPAGFVNSSDLMTGEATSDHDPYDPYRRDMYDENSQPPTPTPYPDVWLVDDYVVGGSGITGMRTRWQSNPLQFPNGLSAYRLIPLVYSSGSDGEPALHTADENIIALDPYQLQTDIDGVQALIGTPDANSGEALDNIHNHLLDGS